MPVPGRLRRSVSAGAGASAPLFATACSGEIFLCDDFSPTPVKPSGRSVPSKAIASPSTQRSPRIEAASAVSPVFLGDVFSHPWVTFLPLAVVTLLPLSGDVFTASSESFPDYIFF